MLMTTTLFRNLLLFAGLSLFTSCISFKNIEVREMNIDNFAMQGSKILVDFSATVHNPNRAFLIQTAQGELNRGQHPFAVAELMQPIAVKGKSEQRYSGQLQLTVRDLLALFQMGTDSRSWNIDSFLFTGDLQVKSGCIKKKFTYSNVSLAQLINSLQP